MPTGRVKWFNSQKGFGFIERKDEADVFVHHTQMMESLPLSEGDEVSFEVGLGRKGPEARQVRRVVQGQSARPVAPSVIGPTGTQSVKPATPAPASHATPVVSITRTPAPPPPVAPATPAKADCFPYIHVPRKEGKCEPLAKHDRLLPGRFDLAFEVVWRTESATALNPCTEVNADGTIDKNFPKLNEGKDSGYAGYANRWLTIDNKLAISPFTVKSAVANGFAALLGGCYRVVSKKVGHKECGDSYPYTGGVKRQRVDRSCSKAGIVLEIGPFISEQSYRDLHAKLPESSRNILESAVQERGGGFVASPCVLQEKAETAELIDVIAGLREGYYVSIQPVREYLLDTATPNLALVRHQQYLVTFNQGRYRTIVGDLQTTGRPKKSNQALVTYHGRYRFGIECILEPGDLNKHHYHRFYECCDDPVEGIIPAENFLCCEELKKIVYMGDYLKFGFPDHPLQTTIMKGLPWYENLHEIRPAGPADAPTDWVYYEMFSGKVTNIGKNFLFKALFRHTDAVPAGNKLCNSLEVLCPRCAMFGPAGHEEGREVAAFRGRFKSSTLVCTSPLPEPTSIDENVPETYGEQPRQWKITPHQGSCKGWGKGSSEIARQFLLPILAQPKVNKRDVKDGCFNQKTGNIKGTRQTLHALLIYEDLHRLVDGLKTYKGNVSAKLRYEHRLRNWAQVCKDDLEFRGTLGVENCSVEEAAALLILLEQGIADHGFKLGLGKSLGMGSVTSQIKKVWVREASDMKWNKVATAGQPDIVKSLEEHVTGIAAKVAAIKDCHPRVFKLDRETSRNRRLKYGLPIETRNGDRIVYRTDAKNRTPKNLRS